MNLDNLLEAIREDYKRWMLRLPKEDESNIRERMCQEFCDALHVVEGSKYYKVVMKSGTSGQSVWGFVVKTAKDKKFAQGDILKPASWAAPARNKPRGNVLQEDFSWVQWCGPEYL